MSNGSNDFGVSYSGIAWIDRVLRSHGAVIDVTRSNDICFHILRKQGQGIRLTCLDEYACGVANVVEVLDAFPDTNLVYVGGNWNGYTQEAKEFCLARSIGLFNSSEINGALYRDDFWAYHRRNDEGNPIYPYQVA